MTSEVLMLNKDAVVIAADSAVTTGREPHPRYSKSANKIFDLTVHGNVAVTIFAAADIDRVPWELALKLFRQHDSKNAQRPKLDDYVKEVTKYLEKNTSLFPADVLLELLKKRFLFAAGAVLRRVGQLSPDFIDENKAQQVRQAAWASGQTSVAQELAALTYATPLTQNDHQYINTHQALLEAEIAPILQGEKLYQFANSTQLTQLAIEFLVKKPTEILTYSGLVFAGYGAEEIFPSFVHIQLYGHIGTTLFWQEVKRYEITHTNDALILPFAQSSMIDRFTDGFDSSLHESIFNISLESFKDIVSDLNVAGSTINSAVSNPIVDARHKEFMEKWRNKNWDENYHPLRRVLNSLSVPEMGHLAESLLVLEELRERVTSPSESVGGPIDVVVITKAEGLLWLKRKHFFEPGLNQRYFNRVNLEYA